MSQGKASVRLSPAARLKQDAKEMLGFIADLPWPAIRVFLFGALLIVGYKFFCAKKSFYKLSVRPLFDFNHQFFSLGYRAWMYLSTFVLLFVVAVLIARLIDKNKLRDLGLGLGDWRFGLRWGAIFLAAMLPVVFVVSFTDTFADKYPLAEGASASLVAFLVWEALSFLYFMGWEFYFRGYLLFSLYKYVGSVAVFVSLIPFVLLHSAKPLPEALGAIFVAVLLCAYALRAGSFWYGMVVHWAINAAMDVAAVWQNGWFGS